MNLLYDRLFRYDTNIVEATGVRETSPTLSIHDIKLLLLRFADVQSFSEDTGGGGRESNIRLVPYEMHAILYVLTTYDKDFIFVSKLFCLKFLEVDKLNVKKNYYKIFLVVQNHP
jgi:hypothetical protein